MRPAFLLVGLLLTASAASARAQDDRGIEWNHDLAAANRREDSPAFVGARGANKFLFFV